LIDGFQAHPKDFDLAPLNFSRIEGLPEFRHSSVPTPHKSLMQVSQNGTKSIDQGSEEV
jgi:hypothetical protein